MESPGELEMGRQPADSARLCHTPPCPAVCDDWLNDDVQTISRNPIILVDDFLDNGRDVGTLRNGSIRLAA
jgi:hypothetical protein